MSVIENQQRQFWKPSKPFPSRPRICLGMPVIDSIPGETFPHHLLLAAVIGRIGDLVLSTPLNKMPHDRARTEIMEFALETGCDYLMFVDDDNICPSDAVPRLIEAMQATGAAVVSGHYFRRGFDYTPVWVYEVNGKPEIVTAPEVSGVQEIHASGLGCALVNLEFIRQTMPNPPWFQMGFDGRCSIVMDDLSFYRRTRAAGGLILGHPGVRCGHLGERKLIDDRSVQTFTAWDLADAKAHEERLKSEKKQLEQATLETANLAPSN
jgi:hypothetical protein